MIDVVARALVTDTSVCRQRPVAFEPEFSIRPGQMMRRRQPLDVSKNGSARILIEVEEQKVADRLVIQFIRHVRVEANTIEGIAEDQTVANPSVIKRLDPKMVPPTEQALAWTIPYPKCKVAHQVLQAVFAPLRIRTQDQFFITYRLTRLRVLDAKVSHQLGARVNSCISGDPGSATKGEWLPLM